MSVNGLDVEGVREYYNERRNASEQNAGMVVDGVLVSSQRVRQQGHLSNSQTVTVNK